MYLYSAVFIPTSFAIILLTYNVKFEFVVL